MSKLTLTTEEIANAIKSHYVNFESRLDEEFDFSSIEFTDHKGNRVFTVLAEVESKES